MDDQVADLYVCPTCKGQLALKAERYQGRDITEGTFSCAECSTRYPIRSGIPIFRGIDLGLESLSQINVDFIEAIAPEDLQEAVIIANQIHHDRVAPAYEDNPYTRQFLPEGTPSQARIREVINFVYANTRRRLFLDIGCGTGNVLKIGQQSFDTAIGVDVSFEMLRIAHARGLEVCLAAAQSLPFRRVAIDAISCFSVLHHISNLGALVREFSRVLVTGGYLYTDWDPSRQACELDQQLANSPVYVALVSPYRLARDVIRRTSRKPSLPRTETPDLIERIGEFHIYHGQGLDATQVKQLLSAVGFETQLYYHNDASAILTRHVLPIQARLRLRIKLWFAYHRFYQIETRWPILATLSRKSTSFFNT